MSAPIAPKKPKRLEQHGDVRIDDYYWLRERENPEVLRHLEAENAWAEEVMAHTRGLQERLYGEIVGRIPGEEESVPSRRNGDYFYARHVEGGEYAVFCRKVGSLQAQEEILLDGNEAARGHDFFQVGGVSVCPGRELLAYAVDTVGRRQFTLRLRDLATGQLLEESIPGISGNFAWAGDRQSLLYARQDPETLRPYQIWLHRVGTDVAKDRLVYEESDTTFSAYVYRTRSEAFLMIASFQTLSSEYRFVDATRPDGEFEVVLPRARDHEYEVDHVGDEFYLRTNREARNFRLVRTPVGRSAPEHWTEVVPHRGETFLEGFAAFDEYLVTEERRDGLVALSIRDRAGKVDHELEFDEPTYSVGLGDNPETGSRVMRFVYTSLTTPVSVFDYDLRSRHRTLRKEQPVVGGLDKSLYRTTRHHAEAADGTRIPISVVSRRDLGPAAERPLLLYSYGSYGASVEAAFSSARLSLLDRGFSFAIAHVRGGSELGRAWYEGGKLLEKKNTFSDFVSCATHLAGDGLCDPARLFAYGGSAGGLLVGAVLNERPELFLGAVAAVPFVDVVTTMLDESIPLTTGEYDEWGDPRLREFYDYILSYSPYDNVGPRDYPHLLVTAGLHDSQVQYWEPAKWVARIRAVGRGDRRLLLRTELSAGHGGRSGRFRAHQETAFNYAFCLDLAGIAE